MNLPATRQRHIARIDHGHRPRTNGVVLHTTESPPGSLPGVRNYFATSSPDAVGAHVGVDTDGRVEQWADLGALVYHARGANSAHIGIEQIGHASQSTATWRARRRQRKVVANRVAYICWAYRLGQPRHGHNVFGHYQFPAGGHTDPGSRFQWDLTMAACRRAYRNLKASNGKRWTR